MPPNAQFALPEYHMVSGPESLTTTDALRAALWAHRRAPMCHVRKVETLDGGARLVVTGVDIGVADHIDNIVTKLVQA